MSDRDQWITPEIPIFENWNLQVGSVLLSEFGIQTRQGIHAHPFDVAAMLHPRDPIARLDVVLEKILARVDERIATAQRRIDLEKILARVDERIATAQRRIDLVWDPFLDRAPEVAS